jgi:hypothetical protein
LAEDLNRQSTPGALPAPTTATPDESIVRRPPSEWESAPHAGRFMIAYGLLGLVLGAAVVGLAVGLTGGNGNSNKVAWSTWKPTASGSKEVDQIVEHVSTRYKLANGRLAVAVVPLSPKMVDPPLTAAAVDTQALFPSEQPVNAYSLDKSLIFEFCGDGTACTLSTGKNPTAELRYLRREALELSLYTFHYMPGVSSTVTFLPPNPTVKGQQQPSTALFFRKDQYAKFASEPLANTLPGTPLNSTLSADDSALVDQLTLPALYRYQLRRSPDGSGGLAVFVPVVPRS